MMKAKKSLGQNWLKSESAIKEIIKTADLQAGEIVLEIGPGRGALTEKLLASGCQVLAVEKDDQLIGFLKKKFSKEIKSKKLILIHDDILKIDFSDLIINLDSRLLGNDKGEKNSPHEAKPRGKIRVNYKLVANIPYYITGQIIRKFLSEEKIQPSRMVLMLQKEVAKRIVGKNPSTMLRVTDKESLLSLSVKVYGTPKYIKTVPAGAFEPKPKVDSAILLIENISRNFFSSTKLGINPNISEAEFFVIIKKGFGQKRKQLKGNLGISAEDLKSCQLAEKIRAEDLSLEDWKCLIKKIKN